MLDFICNGVALVFYTIIIVLLWYPHSYLEDPLTRELGANSNLCQGDTGEIV